MRISRREFLAAVGSTLSLAFAPAARAEGGSVFHFIYDHPQRRERFVPFLAHVFRLVPEGDLDALIASCVAAHADDGSIYRAIVEGLPGITPLGSSLRYALPSLRRQKDVLGDQIASLYGAGDRIDGYLEIGTAGTYVAPLRQRLSMTGPAYLLADREPGYGPADILQRGSVRSVASFVPMGDYDPIAREQVPDDCLDLVTCTIGLHHAPEHRLEPFVESLLRVLRPGGRLVVREHDVADAEQEAVVTLAHEVFNAGTYVAPERNEAEIRNFRSLATWTTFYDGMGLRRVEEPALQSGDPTDNALICLVRA